MIKALLIKRLVALGFTVAVTAVIPFLLQDRPVLSAVWGKFGPTIVDVAKNRIDDKLDN